MWRHRYVRVTPYVGLWGLYLQTNQCPRPGSPHLYLHHLTAHYKLNSRFQLKKNRKWNVINSFELALQYYSQNRKSAFLQYGLPSELYDNNNIRYIICMIVLRRKCHGFDESAHSTKTYMTILVIHCIFTYIR